MASRCPWSRQEVVVLILCCLTTAALSTQQQLQQQFLQEPELAGVLPSTHWLFHMAHTSKLNCAAVCGQQSRCHAFTFVGSRTGECYGLCSAENETGEGAVVAGARTYMKLEQAVFDCHDLVESALSEGIIQLSLNSCVLCDGSWLVFQRRQSGVVNFYRGWDDYRNGFGQEEEHWLGLEAVRQVTSQGLWNLRIDLRDQNNNSAHATYFHFRLGLEDSFYPLMLDCYIDGTAGDSLMEKHGGHPFSTKDRDHGSYKNNCAVIRRGAWWFNKCMNSNLNGDYNTDDEYHGIVWGTWRPREHSLPFTEMKIQRVNRFPSSCA